MDYVRHSYIFLKDKGNMFRKLLAAMLFKRDPQHNTINDYGLEL